MILKLILLGKFYSVHFRSQLQYRISFIFDMFGTFIVTLTEFASIALVLPRFGSLGGWQLGEIAFLYGLVNISFGLTDILFSGFHPRNFGQRVRLGSFDQLLLRPINITLQVLGSTFETRRIGRIFMGFALFWYALFLVGVQWSAIKLFFVGLTVFSQVAYFGGLFMIGSTFTFWTIDAIEAINIFTYGGTELISYPMHIYPVQMRKFFTYILPAIFLNYYPTEWERIANVALQLYSTLPVRIRFIDISDLFFLVTTLLI
jgi:ABC-2 type transport system permease protein